MPGWKLGTVFIIAKGWGVVVLLRASHWSPKLGTDRMGVLRQTLTVTFAVAMTLIRTI